MREADDRDSLLLGLVENVAREQLSAVEEARAYATLLDEFELSLGDVAERVGRSKPTVSNRVRLLELPDDVLAMLERGELTEGHARAVLAVPGHDERRRLARKIVRRGPVGARGRAGRAHCAARARTGLAAAARVDPGARRARPAGGGARDRARGAGSPARVWSSRSPDEAALAELAEAFERLVP